MNNFQDYKLLSKEDKMDFLLAQWEMESPILKGIINVENEIAVIEDLKNYKNIELKNPFRENEIIKEIPVYFGEKSSLLKSNEKVFFYFKPIQGPQIEENLISVDLNHFDTVHEIMEFSKKIAAINFSQEDLRFFDHYLEKKEEYLIKIFDYFKPRFDEEFKKEKSEIEKKARVVKKLKSKENDLSLKVSQAKEERQTLEEEVNSLINDKQRISYDLSELERTKQSLESEIYQLSKQSEDIKNEIMAFKQKKNELETTNITLKQGIEDLNAICEKKRKENDSLEKTIREYQNQLELLQKLGIRVEVKSNPSPTQYDFFDNDEALVNHIQQYLAGRKGNLFYEKNIIKMFYSSLCTNQITVLSGNPGCGKSSLVEGFAEAVSANYKNIAIQPNWTENHDLLGFFDPINEVYMPTPFLDAIVEASENPSDLFIICLDEMNLSYVEYYFSEFLSKMQSSSRQIDLYSKHYSPDLKKENELNFVDPVKKANLIKKITNSQKYPHLLRIPENVRFVGTINKDETTKNLSPKVIDRSCVINIFGHSDKLEKELLKKTNQNELGRKRIQADQFTTKEKKFKEDFLEKLTLLKNNSVKAGIPLNGRFLKQSKELFGATNWEYKEFLDFLTASKILPKINYSLFEDDSSSIIKEIKGHLEITNHLFSAKIFNQMEKNAQKTQIFTFWM